MKRLLMHFRFSRIGVAALVAFALAACSGGQSAVPSAAPQALAPDMTSTAPLAMRTFPFAISPDAKSPCDLGSSIWYFRGSCVNTPIKSAGNKVALKAYKTYALTLTFPKSNAANGDFLLGEGTSSKDITGKFKGAAFPEYGTACYTTKGKSTTCTGSAVLYLFFANNSKNSVVFPSIPNATIATTGAFPGKKSCSMIQIAQDTSGNFVGWYLLTGSGKISGKTVSIPGMVTKSSFAPMTFTVFGYTCQ